MNDHKYVALDVDSADIVAAVFDSKGKCLMECCLKMAEAIVCNPRQNKLMKAGNKSDLYMSFLLFWLTA